MKCFLVILAFLLIGCSDEIQTIAAPKYLSKPQIKLSAKEIKVKKYTKDIAAKELERMLGMPVFNFIEEWIEAKIDAVGGTGEIILEFPLIKIAEQELGQYEGTMKTSLLFKDKGRVTKKINVIVTAVKNFDTNIAFGKKKALLYELLQDMLINSHEGIEAELNKMD